MKFTKELIALLSLNEKKVLDAAWKLDGFNEDLKKILIATLLCVTFIRQKYAARKEEWELILDKAMNWIEKQVKDKSTECLEVAQALTSSKVKF